MDDFSKNIKMVAGIFLTIIGVMFIVDASTLYFGAGSLMFPAVPGFLISYL